MTKKYCKIFGDTIRATLWYPRVDPEKIKYITCELLDVRAADDIRISYDFDRDGWVIEQASIFEWKVDDEVCDEGWQEVAFVKAWASKKKAELSCEATKGAEHD